MRKRLKELDGQANRLLTALAEGTVGDSALSRVKLSAIESEREQCIQLLSRIDTETPRFRQALSNRQAADLAQRLKKALLDAPKAVQRRYVHGLVSEIEDRRREGCHFRFARSHRRRCDLGAAGRESSHFCSGLAHRRGFEPATGAPELVVSGRVMTPAEGGAERARREGRC